MEKNYRIIDVPASNRPNWGGGAFSMFFVYSKNDGNIILRGYYHEVNVYLKRYTHYFCYMSLWHNGESRGFWKFWKNDVMISTPSEYNKFIAKNKFTVSRLHHPKLSYKFKRLPKRWIPEFDNF